MTSGRSSVPDRHRRVPFLTDAGILQLARSGFLGIVTTGMAPRLELRLGLQKSTWRVRYRLPDERRQRTVTLGTWPTTSVAQAVLLREEVQAVLERGDDPARHRLQRRNATLDELIEAWLGTASSKSSATGACALRRHLPAFLGRRVRSLDAAELNRALDVIADTVGRSTAARDLRTVFALGKKSG